MTRKKNPKFIGSCGMYVFVDTGDGRPHLLVHRRSKQVSEPGTLCAPGGIVERASCLLADGYTCDFEHGARRTAAKELFEEAGVQLDEATIASMKQLPVGDGTWWGKQNHRNFYVFFDAYPLVSGPEKASTHEMVRSGITGFGKPAGDSYHVWADVQELLARDDLMAGCRHPVSHFLETDEDDGGEAEGSHAQEDVEEPAAEEEEEVEEPAAEDEDEFPPTDIINLDDDDQDEGFQPPAAKRKWHSGYSAADAYGRSAQARPLRAGTPAAPGSLARSWPVAPRGSVLLTAGLNHGSLGYGAGDASKRPAKRPRW
eukprot:gnl/TRDRNA2_/TRDRNA2_36352_c0_seq1.p1 gnl/TRDRNA2_/TRDRNA2_36352_c0~~gnl/TRDRNA2_/TRDRNA2_36352_c0_seq1.p1  ORF type:complete len:314 (-),score=71.67 gnl/TRDRNA2_/TRDRNA2_36352_c0_seq1:130-1071(-)